MVPSISFSGRECRHADKIFAFPARTESSVTTSSEWCRRSLPSGKTGVNRQETGIALPPQGYSILRQVFLGRSRCFSTTVEISPSRVLNLEPKIGPILGETPDFNNSGEHGLHSDELPRRRFTGWFATINKDNLSQCAAPSVDPSKRLDVPGEYWRPRRKPRAQELKTRTHADPNCVSRIAARP